MCRGLTQRTQVPCFSSTLLFSLRQLSLTSVPRFPHLQAETTPSGLCLPKLLWDQKGECIQKCCEQEGVSCVRDDCWVGDKGDYETGGSVGTGTTVSLK